MKKEAQIFKALSEEVRLRIMLLLTHRELRVQDLVDITGLPQSTLSRHLAYLKKERLVVVRGEQAQSVYGVNRDNVPLTKSIMNCLENCFSENRIAKKDSVKLRAKFAVCSVNNQTGTETRVLFVCHHNSARSQMAEAYVKKFGGNDIIAESAGIAPGGINHLVAEALREDGVDITGCRSKNISDLITSGNNYEYVITVCAESEALSCPVVDDNIQRLHWEFTDPSLLTGTDSLQLDMIRKLRDQIKKQVENLILTIRRIKK